MPTARVRERIIKLMLIAVIGLPFVLLFWMQPRRPKLPDQTPASPSTRIETVPSEIPPSKSPPHETSQTALQPVAQPQSPTEPALPTIDVQLAESRQKLTEARTVYQRVRNRADADLLAKFGGNEWQHVQELLQQAEFSTQPSAAIELWQQAKDQLVALLPQLSTRQQMVQLRDLELAGNDHAFLTALREATTRHPTEFDPIWQQVATWNEARWLAMCQAELQRLTPDDAGFSEIWLALADYYEFRNDSAAAHDALGHAWSAIPRMTQAVRAAESGLDCLRRFSDAPSSRTPPEALQVVATLINQIRDGVRRSEYLADLSGLAHKQNDLIAAAQYLRDSEAISQKTNIVLTSFLPKINRCRALSAYASSEHVFDACVAIPKFDTSGFDWFPANTMGYAHAASAAVRTKDLPSIWRGLLLAEAQQLDAAEYQIANAFARRLLAQVDLARGEWRRAVITANNLADPTLRASILYPVMHAAPLEVPHDVGLALIALRPTDRGAAPAIATYLPHYLARERSTAEWQEWIGKLPNSSARAASYLAFARHAAAPTEPPVPAPAPRVTPNMDDARSLLEAAEASANTLQEPLPRAYAQLWMAVCWHRLQKPATYARACDQLHLELFRAWKPIWKARSPVASSVGNRYYADQASYAFKAEYRDQQELSRRQQSIMECYTLLAEIQAFHLHDPRRAIETALNAASASHTLVEAKSELRIRLRSIVEAVHQDCELPTGLMDSAIDPVQNYLRMILATSKPDLNNLKTRIQLIETEGPGRLYKRLDCAARGHVELALMAAKLGQLDEYRAARRTATSLIQTQGAITYIRIPLIEADAYAGEFELALQSKRDRERLPIYGTVSRPLSTLCVELCRVNRLAEAEPLLPAISEPFWKLRAMHAVAAARLQNHPTDNHLDWVAKLDDPFLRVAAYCGLALREPRLW